MGYIQSNLIDPLSAFLYTWVLVPLLVCVALYFTVRTRGVQFRYFGRALRQLRASGSGAAGGISSFQAFAVGIASRVGTGNIAGVAIALTLGGPGAIFWMWIVALFGMATAFIEATLAQAFKVRSPDGSFRGGPAYYIQRGMGSRPLGILFAILLIFTFGIAFNMVQANTISDVLESAHTVDTTWTAIILMIASAPVLFGGVRLVAKIAGRVVPLMAAVYVGLAALIIVMNITELPNVLSTIVKSAFGSGPAAAGIAGGVANALMVGVKRGLFSNEAGMGSAPNAAATATTSHPVKQGLVQQLGVFVDTILICTATAFIIMFSGIYKPGTTPESEGASLTQAAVAGELGSWSSWLMTVLVLVFAYSSLLGNYSYAEVNMDYLGGGRAGHLALRLAVLASIGIGSVLALGAVWAFADVAMAFMAILNLAALLVLGRWAFGLLKDYERSTADGRDPVFSSVGNPDLPGELPTDVWNSDRVTAKA